ncbi:MAG: DUF58 domain-containing protein [Lentisphaeria bacterium]|jgi:uncharacterized protein (DUF58 family)|nr:DUF58 domain-containing protein [Lentisphaeria bacterium]MDY0176225.1 DUF58 domain-containing protein [Lentisphaeria bacterium]
MLPKDLAKKLRYIQIRTSKTVSEAMAGEYKSAFRGSGMEFDEVREYQPGDDVRSIDWNVTARQGRPFIKRFHEERELTVVFMIDLSASGKFGTANISKNELAAELCALLAFSAVRNNDKVGLLLFTDDIELYIPPAKGLKHAMRIIRQILGYKAQGRKTNIAAALDYLGKLQRRRAVVFLVSDFLDRGYEAQLRRLARRHDLVAVSLSDALEHELPALGGMIELEDAESGEMLLFDAGSAKMRQAYARLGEERQQRLQTELRGMGIDQLKLRSDQDYQHSLVRFLRMREKKS